MLATDKNYEEASHYLKESNGHVKSAILMAITGMNLQDAKSFLDGNDGFIKKALFAWRDRKK
jgi:N-acetylmuramic acid 6-phosphate etherase